MFYASDRGSSQNFDVDSSHASADSQSLSTGCRHPLCCKRSVTTVAQATKKGIAVAAWQAQMVTSLATMRLGCRCGLHLLSVELMQQLAQPWACLAQPFQ